MKKRFSELDDEGKKEYYREQAKAYYHANKEKSKAANKEWREKNKDLVREKQKNLKRERKDFAIKYLGGICNRCGNSFHPAVFEFHHKDPDNKLKDPSKLLNCKLDRLIEELNQCILVCANCHRLIHHEENY